MNTETVPPTEPIITKMADPPPELLLVDVPVTIS